jgi:hypothetical protein
LPEFIQSLSKKASISHHDSSQSSFHTDGFQVCYHKNRTKKGGAARKTGSFISVIPALKRLRQERSSFKDSEILSLKKKRRQEGREEGKEKENRAQ